jgi:hypothetical protein
MSSGFTKGGRDFLDLGNHNVMCAYCGRKRKASELTRDDEFARGLWACPEHADMRHPQDFARGIKEDMTAPFVQPPIVAFTSLPATFPLTITPPKVILLGGPPWTAFVAAGLPPWISPTLLSSFTADSLVTADSEITVDTVGSDPTAEVFVISYNWSWQSGGAGITIVPTWASTAELIAQSTGLSGILQLIVTNSLGQTATATASVSD